jgi:hypothetical protein
VHNVYGHLAASRQAPLKTAITEHEFFQFDATEIATMRRQFGVLAM